MALVCYGGCLGAKSLCDHAFFAFAVGAAVWFGASDCTTAPYLRGVEKGNLVLLCFVCFFLAKTYRLRGVTAARRLCENRQTLEETI